MNDKDKTYAIDYGNGEKETRVPLGAIRYPSSSSVDTSADAKKSNAIDILISYIYLNLTR